MSLASSFRAPAACRTERISIQCPSSVTSTSVTSSQKNGVVPGRNRLKSEYPNATVMASDTSIIVPGSRFESSVRAIERNGSPPYAKTTTASTGVIQALPGNVGAV